MRNLLALVLLLSVPAWAQKVVILEIDGDGSGKLRQQIEDAVQKAGAVELVSIGAYKAAAAKRKLKGGAAMTAAGVARTSKALKFDAAVGGEVSATSYHVMIYDRSGQELWQKDLAVKKGMLSDDFAGKLARAIAAAAEQGAARTTTDTGNGGEDTGTGGTGDEGGGGIDLTNPGGGTTTGGGGVIPTPEDPNRDTDLENEGRRRKSKNQPVPLVKAWLGGTTTWRSQCLRPGVTACREYELAMPKPDGIVIDFTATVPYLGLALNLEAFPLARFDNRILQGFGVLVGFHYGQSLTRIVEETPQGQGPEKPVTSVDLGWSFQATWRYHFNVGLELLSPGSRTIVPLGYVGLRAGLLGRSFNIDPTAGTSLPSSQRSFPTGIGFPVFGFDASIPIAKYFHVDLGASIFLNPRPAPEQIVGYGNLNDPTGGASSSGWSFEGGFSGDAWGPLGWLLHLRTMNFSDRFYGQGQKWTVCNDQQCGGAAEETFVSVIWGVTGSF